ncbi:hypothetical protein NQ318_012413 [Aromia moschata]|uniref:Uncharacterized protein n=1 Tax=Aromia moschata TaxID=1265417 RepID=A0AAV8Y3M1_9CUCU|nr:hypothetical protein NQ318_012413 [Aromia moschata]
MTAKEDRSLGSGMPIPKWMKSKMSDTYDFGQTAFSPTELDDSFMYYYRHQGGSRKNSESKVIATPNLPDKITVSQVSNKIDFSKHPTPCQKYIHGISAYLIIGLMPWSPPQTTPEMRIKSPGTDDGFKGEAAKCGSSIIRVASQMVSGKMVHGFTVKEDECEQSSQAERYDGRQRRGSKSLPASPLRRPAVHPKALGGRSTSISQAPSRIRTNPEVSGWILSNLLARREISQSMGYIGEETKEELERSSSTASVRRGLLVEEQGSLLQAEAFRVAGDELLVTHFHVTLTLG